MLETLLFVCLVTVLPITLVKITKIQGVFRLAVFALVLAMVVVIVQYQKLSFVEMGFRLDTAFQSIVPYTVFSGVCIVVLIVLYRSGFGALVQKWYTIPHFLGGFILISFAQEFVFHGFVLTSLQNALGMYWAILVTAVLFGYMHTIYPRPVFHFVITTLTGICWATLFTFFPNILVSTIAHSLLNFIAVLLGFFVPIGGFGVRKE